jgi:hypothetical protein
MNNFKYDPTRSGAQYARYNIFHIIIPIIINWASLAGTVRACSRYFNNK